MTINKYYPNNQTDAAVAGSNSTSFSMLHGIIILCTVGKIITTSKVFNVFLCSDSHNNHYMYSDCNCNYKKEKKI